MKAKIKDTKTVMQQLREIRDAMSEEMKDMTIDQLKEYLNRQKTLHPPQVWRNAK